MQFKKIAVATVCLAGMTVLSGCHADDNKAAAQTTAQPAGKVMAVVNNVGIPEAELDLLKQQAASQGQPVNDKMAAALRDNLINGEILAQQAAKKGMDKDPTIQTQLELAKTQMLANAYIRAYAKANPLTDDQLKAEYDRLKSLNSNRKEYDFEQIHVDSEDKAKAIIAKLDKKAKFEELVKKDSMDPPAPNGGTLKLALPDPENMIPKEIADTLSQLKAGEYTKTPVHMADGWHVIKVVDVHALQFPAFDQIKDRLRGELEQQKVQKMIADLRASAKIQ